MSYVGLSVGVSNQSGPALSIRDRIAAALREAFPDRITEGDIVVEIDEHTEPCSADECGWSTGSHMTDTSGDH